MEEIKVENKPDQETPEQIVNKKRKNFKIFKFRDETDIMRMAMVVCVVDEKSDVRAHISQDWHHQLPEDYDDFIAKFSNAQIVLSVKDFPNLTRQIKQALKELRQ